MEDKRIELNAIKQYEFYAMPLFLMPFLVKEETKTQTLEKTES